MLRRGNCALFELVADAGQTGEKAARPDASSAAGLTTSVGSVVVGTARKYHLDSGTGRSYSELIAFRGVQVQ